MQNKRIINTLQRSILGLMLVSTMASNLLATTYFVRVDGNDNLSGQSWADAWASVNKVNNAIPVGDTVFFGSGIYYGGNRPPSSGDVNNVTVYSCSTMTTATQHVPKAQAKANKIEMERSPNPAYRIGMKDEERILQPPLIDLDANNSVTIVIPCE